jgi:hypothetical protein
MIQETRSQLFSPRSLVGEAGKYLWRLFCAQYEYAFLL